MKFATILAVVGASAASAGNSINVIQDNKSGNNSIVTKQKGSDNFLGAAQFNKRGNNSIDAFQKTGKGGSNAIEALQENKRGNNDFFAKQVERRR